METKTNLDKLRELTSKLAKVKDITEQLKEIKDRFILLDSSINLMIYNMHQKIQDLTKEMTNGK